MKITTSSYHAEPLFPAWMFTSQLQLSATELKSIVDAETNATCTKTSWGWSRKDHPYSKQGLQLARLVGTSFFDIVSTQFHGTITDNRLITMPDGNKYDMEISKFRSYSINQDQYLPVNWERGRWYTGLLCLNAPHQRHELEVPNNFTVSQTHPSMKNDVKVMAFEPQKIVFLPGQQNFNYIPSANTASKETLMMQFNFILKRK